MRNEIFRANLAQKTNPKRTHFSHSFLRLRFEDFSGSWSLALGMLLSSSNLHSHPKSTFGSICERLIRVENELLPTSHRPKIRPENKGIKPITNRHKPKKFISGRCPQRMVVRKGHCDVHPSVLAPSRVKSLQPIIGYYSLFTPIFMTFANPGLSRRSKAKVAGPPQRVAVAQLPV